MADITSPANPRVKWLVGLRKRSHRDAERLTVVEGYAECALALRSGAAPRLLAHCPDLHHLDPADGSGPDELHNPDGPAAEVVALARQRSAEVMTLGQAAFARASYRESPDGWLLVVSSPERPLDEIRLSPAPLVLVAEAVEKPGNLGAMLRTADAAGVDAVVSADPVTDWGNPNLVRASKASVFAVPVASASTDETIDWLRAQRIQPVLASPSAPKTLYDVDLTAPTAVVVGAEHAGLTARWSAVAEQAVSIPMHGRVDSLNVATSAAILLYEAVRQRADRAG